MAEKIEFDLKVGVNDLDKAFNNAISGSKKLGDTVSTALGVFGGGVALKGFELLGDAVSATTDFLKDSVKAAAEQEDALNKLSQALRTTGSFSEQAVEDFSNFASELQRASIFGDEVVIGQLAIAKSFGATNQQAKDLVQAAANLSATFGGSLEENVFKLGKTLSGVVNRDFKAAIPEIKSLSVEALRTGEAINLINQQFSGAAASQLDTYSGRTTSLSNAFSDLQEEIGAYVTKSESLSKITSIATGIFQELTDEIVQSRIEQQRANGTLVETEGTLNVLSERYAKVTADIEKYQAVINEDKNKTLLESLFSFDNAPLAKERVQSLTAELSKLQSQIDVAAASVANAPTANEDAAKNREVLTEQEINAVAQKNAQIIALDQELALEQQRLATENAAIFLETDAVQKQAILDSELQFQLDKNQILLDQQIASSELLGSEQEKAAARSVATRQKELNDLKAAGKFQIETDKLRIASDKAVAQEKINNLQRVSQVTAQVGQLATTLAREGSTAQFVISKAFSLGQIGIARATGIANALLLPPPAQPAAIAAANITAGIAAAQVAASSIKFENGGFVGGLSGATSGPDNRVATIRDGEMILNASQQKTLLDAINGGAIGGEIVIQIDGKEVARAVRNQVKSGFNLGVA